MSYARGTLLALVCGFLLLSGCYGDGGPAAPTESVAQIGYAARADDWRARQVVYHILVDRFRRPPDIEAKKGLYAAPQVLHEDWTRQPVKGRYLNEHKYWSHELEFWGGDLRGVIEKLEDIKALGVNTLYFNPIFHAYTHHKYDTIDYMTIDPQYGTWDDFLALVKTARAAGFRIVLDGVFNHVSIHHPWFKDAADNPKSAFRDFFYFGNYPPHGYKAWHNVANLPTLNLDNPKLKALIYDSPDSVVQKYMAHIDGWRLDAADEIGHAHVKNITQAAHRAKSDALVLGEIWTHPESWLTALDGVLHMNARNYILGILEGNIRLNSFHVYFEQLIRNAGIDKVLASWLAISNHDTPRLATRMPDPKRRRLAWTMLFTLPGSPLIYYGEEHEMTGGDDPTNRGPMPWPTEAADNAPRAPTYELLKALTAFRNQSPALQYGDIRFIPSGRLLAYIRHTDKPEDTRIVVINTDRRAVSERLSLADAPIGSAKTLISWPAEAQVTIGGAAAEDDKAAPFYDCQLEGYEFVILRPAAE